MTNRLLVLSFTAVADRLRFDPQRGQGTVEYVALILLVAAVLAAAVVAAHSSHFHLTDIVTAQLDKAIKEVSK